MRVFLSELAIWNLTGRYKPGDPEFIPSEEAWQILRDDSPVDFGDDLEKWATWVDQEFTSIRRAAEGASG